MTESMRWADGWTFYSSGGKPESLLPPPDDCLEWMKGYGTAMADYGMAEGVGCIQDALARHGIAGGLLEACLQAAEAVLEGDDWVRWPFVPVRAKRPRDKIKPPRDSRRFGKKGAPPIPAPAAKAGRPSSF